MYSTSLLRVILRSNPVAFSNWGLTLVVSQLHDTNQLVMIESALILDEALEDRVSRKLAFLFDSLSTEILFRD